LGRRQVRKLTSFSARQKWSAAAHYHLLRALTYFEDAESVATLPAELTRGRWQAIKAWFEEHAARALRRLVAKGER
jgi:hypothetical protein